MTLLEVVQNLDAQDDEHTIYAACPWTQNSTALLMPSPEDGRLPPEAKERGLEYFLEVFIAREVLTDWKENVPAPPTLEEEVFRLIQYAINDA